MRLSLVFFSILGLVAAWPVDKKYIEETFLKSDVSRNSVIEGQLHGLLEDLRQTILTGSDTVPVLDPLVLDYLAADDSLVPLPGLRVEIGEAKVDKLSTFVINDLSVQRATLLPLRYRVTFDLHIPVLEVDARHYDLFVPIDGLATIFGTGDAKINLVEPRVTGNVLARVSIGLGTLFVSLEECQINFSLREFDPHINGLLGGDDAMSAFINAFLKNLVYELLELYEAEITEGVSGVVMEVANAILADMNLFDILG